MGAITLDVIIAVKDRTTVARCVFTLLAQINLVEEIALGKILLCDGGSLTQSCQQQLAQVAELTGVEVLPYSHQGFNKGWLLNKGLAAATARLVLISDIDILWDAATIKALALAVVSEPNRVYSVRSVKESNPAAKAIRRQRYAYRIVRTAEAARVEVYLAPLSAADRPGCGLLCAEKRVLQQIGGYRDCFWGWGWEDQDLLIRAQLLGCTVATLGSAVHLTHGDDSRNALHGQCSHEWSRDRNILRCLNGLAKGQLLGDLQQCVVGNAPNVDNASRHFPCSVSVQCPPNLAARFQAD